MCIRVYSILARCAKTALKNDYCLHCVVEKIRVANFIIFYDSIPNSLSTTIVSKTVLFYFYLTWNYCYSTKRRPRWTLLDPLHFAVRVFFYFWTVYLDTHNQSPTQLTSKTDYNIYKNKNENCLWITVHNGKMRSSN